MEINKRGLWNRIFIIVVAIYFLTVGSCGLNNYYYQKSIVSELKSGTLFGRYVPLTALEKETISQERNVKYNECNDKSDQKNDVFCALEFLIEANYSKKPNYLSIGLALALPVIVWIVLGLFGRLGRWVLTGK